MLQLKYKRLAILKDVLILQYYEYTFYINFIL